MFFNFFWISSRHHPGYVIVIGCKRFPSWGNMASFGWNWSLHLGLKSSVSNVVCCPRPVVGYFKRAETGKSKSWQVFFTGGFGWCLCSNVRPYLAPFFWELMNYSSCSYLRRLSDLAFEFEKRVQSIDHVWWFDPYPSQIHLRYTNIRFYIFIHIW